MKYVCIHGHFYQPPRENPWLETIELQDSAYPYHDWNERINAECYAPNGAARILDGDGRIAQIVNNYSQISYDFGPTLLSWMQANAPRTYNWILEADRESAARFSGHGSAMAQCYNHIIMPLANRRDKYTQIRWGIRDFVSRFRRPPEGMWLPETAVDLETLDLMAEQGIKFTILAPYQCKRVRKSGSRSWKDVTGGKIDPTMAYRIKLPSHRSIDVFFYDGPISRAVAFERLLDNGERFAHRLVDSFPDCDSRPSLVHIATDGETYGHHHRHGEMALSYALQYIQSRKLAEITNYGEFLERYPPTHEVEIYENTAWSCSHGVERWNSNCGCNTGGHPGWNQAWRRPLRAALDWLRDTVAPVFEQEGGKLLHDPWAARNDYINVVLDRSPESRAAFLRTHALRELNAEEQVRCWRLLELQRHAMLMYTSCGWFFDELSGIETVQVIQYAGRVVQLAEELSGQPVEAPFLERLECAKSNIPEHADGRRIYEKFVRSAIVDLRKVGAHYAITTMFDSKPNHAKIYCYSSQREHYQLLESGAMRLALGRCRFTSEITQYSQVLTFGVLHFGDHNVTGGVREFQGEEAYQELLAQVTEAFGRADIPEVLRLMDAGFGKNIYSLKTLFKDEQRRIIRMIINSSVDEAGNAYRHLYDRYAPLMSFLSDLDMPLPKIFQLMAEYAINSRFRKAVAPEELDVERIRMLVEESRRRKVELDETTFEFNFRKRMEKLANHLVENPNDLESLQKLHDLIHLVKSLPFQIDWWGVQNSCFELMAAALSTNRARAEAGDETAKQWLRLLQGICEGCGVRLQ
ncbi:MAG: DUF3536 domain-containing protein [Bryobacteraceae bacterium]|nr:DUF3536 domain-containing protein [Bryobacteraceae bacterium]